MNPDLPDREASVKNVDGSMSKAGKKSSEKADCGCETARDEVSLTGQRHVKVQAGKFTHAVIFRVVGPPRRLGAKVDWSGHSGCSGGLFFLGRG